MRLHWQLFGISLAAYCRGHIKKIGLALTATAAMAAFACSSGVPEPETVVFTSRAGTGPESSTRSDIYITRSAEEPPVRLTLAGNQDLSPKWAPNRTQIAFLSQRNGDYEIWITNSTGGDKRAVFTGLGAATRFEWAPDSRRIAYEISNQGRRQIFVGEVATGESTPLTAVEESAHLGSWSPDGDWLVYTLITEERSGIYKGNPKGVNEIEVSSSVGKDPRWSPNGRWIVFTADIDGSQNLVIVPSGSGDETNLTPTAGNNGSPVWSPDSERIAFVSDRDGNAEIYLIDSDGRNEKRLTSNRSDDVAPSWSRRTNRIAFMSDVDGDFDLFTMRPDGSNQRRLTTDDRDIIDLDW